MNPAELAELYVNIWNQADPAQRRATVERLWVPEGEHFVRTLHARGHDALEQRVTSSYEKNVRDAGYRFRVSGQPQPLHDGILFHWDMVRPGAEKLEAYGAVFARLAADGRIAVDYQFILPTPAN